MSDKMNPNCLIYVLHSRQGRLLDDQDLMNLLNLVNDPQCFT